MLTLFLKVKEIFKRSYGKKDRTLLFILHEKAMGIGSSDIG